MEVVSFNEALMASPTKTFAIDFNNQNVMNSDARYDALTAGKDLGAVDVDNNISTVPLMTPVCEENEENAEEDMNEMPNFFISPNGTKVWYPTVDASLIPVLGAVFSDLSDALKMYKDYAIAAGFSVRVGQHKKKDGLKTFKYFRCNRAGIPESRRNLNSKSKIRQVSYKSCDCKAHVLLKFCKKTSSYFVLKFTEGHNHQMVDSFNHDLTKMSRQLPFSTKEYIHNMGLNSVGPVKAHRFLVSLMGGHHNVKGTSQDFKNFSKKTRMYIGDRDSQMVVNRLHERAENLKEFYFDYEVSEGKLKSVFWADEISKINYEAFGDVLAFDATYQTNKYEMIFVPFTGLDNHKRCVTFGAGLLFNETTESYKWLLENFLKAHGRQPTLVLTDQDPSMRKAVLKVFTESKHRLCMWHVMKKLPLKIAGDLLQNTDLRACLHRLVWSNYMKPSTFERMWGELIERFSLGNNEWLSEMYEIRKRWVPAYFRGIPMCCLMKTTSLCESSNSSFKVNSTSANTLVQFMLCYETRIESQRYRQRADDFNSSTLAYPGDIDVAIEKHAFDVYTSTIYQEVKSEITEGFYYCYISNTEFLDGVFVYSVSQLKPVDGVVHKFEVKFEKDDNKAECSCRCFKRIGYLCRHVFCVYRVNLVNEIPSMYVRNRWRRDAVPRRIFNIDNRYGVDNSHQGRLKKEILNLVDECVEVLRSDTDGLLDFASRIKEWKNTILNGGEKIVAVDNSNEAVVEELVGQSLNVDVSIQNPNGIRTKGCGKKRRFAAPGEKLSQKRPKVPRLCHTCNLYVTDHDSRNCKKKKKNKEGDAVEVQSEEKEG